MYCEQKERESEELRGCWSRSGRGECHNAQMLSCTCVMWLYFSRQMLAIMLSVVAIWLRRKRKTEELRVRRTTLGSAEYTARNAGADLSCTPYKSNQF